MYIVTPMQSIYSQLAFEQNQGIRKLDSFKFIWIQRDPVFVKDSDLARDLPRNNISKIQTPSDHPYECKKIDVYDDGDVNIETSASFLANLPQGLITDEELTQYYDGGSTDIESATSSDAEDDDMEMKYSTSNKINNTDDNENNEIINNHNQGKDSVFDLQIYVTGNESDLVGAPHHITKNVRYGRPDILGLFRTMRDDIMSRRGVANGEDGDGGGCIDLDVVAGNDDKEQIEEEQQQDKVPINNRVAVCVCAPSPVAEACRKACIMYSNEHVRFDIHFESMCI
jgi:hypothetical protein